MEEQPAVVELVPEPVIEEPPKTDNKTENQAPDDMKQCSACTLFNALTADTCEVCGNPF